MVDSHVIEACQLSKWIIGVVTHFPYWHRAISLGSRRDRRVRATRRLARTHRSGRDPVVGSALGCDLFYSR